jgi:hypothetical protein
MRLTSLLCLVPLLSIACGWGKGSLDDDDDDDIDDAGDIADLCAEETPEYITQVVSFPAPSGGCDWGVDGNLEAENGYFQARLEQTDSLELPEDAVICDVVFDFEGINGGQGTPMVYDDNFLFTFNDIVLAGSYAPIVDMLPHDELYATYDWSVIAGTELVFDDSIPTYCLGEDAGLAECQIPPPETDGIMSMSFDATIANQLAFVAMTQERYDFTFITMGDNDDSDCSHETFEFEVEIPYITL